MRGSVVLVVYLALVYVALAQVKLVPPEIETFDGKAYAGVILGETRDPDLKANYRVFKSKVYPEALSIEVEDGQPLVDALLDRRGGIATVQGIYIQYPGVGPNVRLLASRLNEEPTYWYHPRRHEPWHAAVFMKRGVVVFIDETDAGPATRSVLLCSPGSVQNGIAELLPEPTKVGKNPDPGFGWNRTVKVSGVIISLTASARVPRESVKDLRKKAQEIAIELGTGPHVIFVRGSRNSYQINLMVVYDSRRDRFGISVRLKLKVDTPYGDIEDEVSLVEYTKVLTETRVLGVIRSGIAKLNREIGDIVRQLKHEDTSADQKVAIERFLRLATVPPP